VVDRHGRLDLLVSNAGVAVDRTVRKMEPKECGRT
jgi:NAD(P)-dependent dehydrogenase (short-subunit alcohol dehydrogenase family)